MDLLCLELLDRYTELLIKEPLISNYRHIIMGTGGCPWRNLHPLFIFLKAFLTLCIYEYSHVSVNRVSFNPSLWFLCYNFPFIFGGFFFSRSSLWVETCFGFDWGFFFFRGNVYSLYSVNTSNSGSWHNATIYSVILIHPCTRTFLFAIDSGSILLGVVTLAPPLFIFPPYFLSLLIGPAFHGVWLAWS